MEAIAAHAASPASASTAQDLLLALAEATDVVLCAAGDDLATCLSAIGGEMVGPHLDADRMAAVLHPKGIDTADIRSEATEGIRLPVR